MFAVPNTKVDSGLLLEIPTIFRKFFRAKDDWLCEVPGWAEQTLYHPPSFLTNRGLAIPTFMPSGLKRHVFCHQSRWDVDGGRWTSSLLPVVAIHHCLGEFYRAHRGIVSSIEMNSGEELRWSVCLPQLCYENNRMLVLKGPHRSPPPLSSF